MDVHDKATRSYNMSRIRSKNTRPEQLVRKFLFSYGFRYRICDKKLPGNPDIVLPKYRTVIFIHGCFWHGHSGCRYFVIPKTRTDWWLQKFETNKRKDNLNKSELRKDGWKVKIIWECELKPMKIEKTLKNLLKYFKIADTSN
jgi:DNA mismatch endonuclease (patch repair protein)